MPQYLNTVTVASPRNGTTTHTVSPSSGTVVGGTPFTPTAGRLLIAIGSAPGTLTNPTGWTVFASSILGGIGGYVHYRYATGTAADNITTTASIANVPAAYAFFEFPGEFAPLSPVGDAALSLGNLSSGTSGGSKANASPTEATPVFSIAVQLSNDDTGAFSTISWDKGTELVDTGVGRDTVAGTDGYTLGVTYEDAVVNSNFAYAATLSRTTPNYNRVTVALYRRLMRPLTTSASSPTALVDAVTVGGFGSIVAGDLLVSMVAIKPSTATVALPAAAVTAGWELAAEATNGTDPSGLDTGSMKVQVYAKRYPAATSYTLLQSGADSICVAQISLRPAAGYTAWDYTSSTTGGDATDDTAFAATGAADITLAADDFMVVAEALNNDAATILGAITPSAPGAAFSKPNLQTVRQATSTVGNQGRVTGFEIAAVGGPSSGPPSIAHNLNAAGSGAVAFLRLRVAVPLETTYQATATGTGTTTGSAAATVVPPPVFASASGLGRTAGYAAATVLLGPKVSDPSSIPSAGTWLTTTNVFTSNDTYATNVGTTQNTEYPMDVGGFNLSALPANATITGVTVTIEAKTGTANRAQIRAELYDGATLLTGVLALTNLTASDANYTFTPTATLAQLKSANLFVRVINKRTVTQASTTSVDYVRISVTYTVPATGNTLLAGAIGDGTTSGSAAADIIPGAGGPTTLSASATGTGIFTGSAAATVSSPVVVTLAQSWNVRAPVTKTLAETWNVRAAVSPTPLAETWNTRANAVATLAQSWNVRAPVVMTLVETWNVSGPVTVMLAQSWQVRAPVDQTLAQSWHVRKTVVIGPPPSTFRFADPMVVSTFSATPVLTMPAGLVATDHVLLAMGTTTGVLVTAVPSGPAGMTYEVLVAPRAATNTVWALWDLTGLVAGDTVTITLSATGPRNFQAFVFSGDIGAAGTIYTRGATSATLLVPGRAITPGARMLVFGVERTVATGTVVSSAVLSSGEPVTQLSFAENVANTDVSFYLGEFTAVASPTGTATVTYSGGSTNGAGVQIIEAAVPGVLPVSTSWNVRATTTTTLAQSWQTRAVVTTTLAQSWHVRALAVTTLAQTWHVRTPVGSSLPQTWNVRAYAIAVLSQTWHVRASVASTLLQSWNTRAFATVTLAQTWHVRAYAVTTLPQTWNVRAAAVATLLQSWQVRALVTTSLAQSWRVRALVSTSLAQSWNVRATVLTTLLQSWNTRSTSTAVTVTLATSWQVRAPVVKTLAETWNVHVAVGSTLAQSWNVRKTVAVGGGPDTSSSFKFATTPTAGSGTTATPIPIPAGVVATDRVLIVISNGGITGSSVTSITGPAGMAYSTPIPPRLEGNLRWGMWEFTGVATGDVVTINFSTILAQFIQLFVFSKDLGPIGAVSTRGGSTGASNVIPGRATQTGAKMLVFSVERTTTAGTLLSSATMATGETVTQLAYNEDSVAGTGNSYYLGEYSAASAAPGNATVTYSTTGNSGGGVQLVEVDPVPSAYRTTSTPAGSAASGTTLALTMPTGTVASDHVLVAFGHSSASAVTVTPTGPAGMTYEVLVAMRNAATMGWGLWDCTGLVAGDVVTLTASVVVARYAQAYVFTGDISDIGTIYTRPSSLAVTTVPGRAATPGTKMLLFATERTTATPTVISSIAVATGEPVTQISYAEGTGFGDVSFYLGEITAEGSSTGDATVTYSATAGTSTNAAGVQIAIVPPPPNVPITTWNVRAFTTTNLLESWQVRALVNTSLLESWHVRVPVGGTLAESWNVRALVTRNLLQSWHVRALTTTSLAERWHVRALVGVTLLESWHVRTTLGNTLVETWHVRAFVDKTLIETWQVRALVSTTLATSWNVYTAAGRLKVWDGVAWRQLSASVWDGTKWVERPVSFWNGTSWVRA